jgi:hypothetical protein
MQDSFEFSSLHRKKTFENFVDVLKGRELPAMDQLGLEFLRLYDGKFNYQEEHTVCESIFVNQIKIYMII